MAREEPETLYLWPCNVLAWRIWGEVQTQWSRDMSGQATGLHYPGVRAHLDECGLEGQERKRIWDGIRAAERATLLAWAERANNSNP